LNSASIWTLNAGGRDATVATDSWLRTRRLLRVILNCTSVPFWRGYVVVPGDKGKRTDGNLRVRPTAA
jgi:hypothetical protein